MTGLVFMMRKVFGHWNVWTISVVIVWKVFSSVEGLNHVNYQASGIKYLQVLSIVRGTKAIHIDVKKMSIEYKNPPPEVKCYENVGEQT